ncbi:MAG: HlyD family type I secretion periplasmic adaptor subunit [OCS116 cluster bacterium]|nr:HlyD family type I secretion periplasmic adaptor subunit [OCS116 cluster bacterium]
MANIDLNQFEHTAKVKGIARKSQANMLILLFIGVVGFILWASVSKVNTVTRGAGKVVSAQDHQIVQHFEGGIISHILVKEGAMVTAGQALFVIQNRFSEAEHSKIKIDLQAKQISLLRFWAEANDQDNLNLRIDMLEAAPEFAQNEMQLFDSRRQNLIEQLAIFNDRKTQAMLDLEEAKNRLLNLNAEKRLVDRQVEIFAKLFKKGATSERELIEIQTTAQRLTTRMDELKHKIPWLKSTLSEAERLKNEIGLRFRVDAKNEYSMLQLEITKLEAALTATQDRTNRNSVLAPIDGVVNKLFVTTIGGVVSGGQDLLEIVPADDSIAIEAKLSPKDRAEIRVGLPAVIKISAYDYSTYGGLEGEIIDISADALTNRAGETFFRVRLKAKTMDFGHGKPVVPGMLADVDILTGEKTILQYLLKPIHKIRENALKQ